MGRPRFFCGNTDPNPDSASILDAWASWEGRSLFLFSFLRLRSGFNFASRICFFFWLFLVLGPNWPFFSSWSLVEILKIQSLLPVLHDSLAEYAIHLANGDVACFVGEGSYRPSFSFSSSALFCFGLCGLDRLSSSPWPSSLCRFSSPLMAWDSLACCADLSSIRPVEGWRRLRLLRCVAGGFRLRLLWDIVLWCVDYVFLGRRRPSPSIAPSSTSLFISGRPFWDTIGAAEIDASLTPSSRDAFAGRPRLRFWLAAGAWS